MSRKITIPLWLCLLCLFPGLTMAQTLEYWFDDLYDLRNTTSIAASDAEQELNLDLRDNTKFPMGFHKLNMRVTIAGKPSAVTSSAVLKLAAGKISQLEYWVDDDIANSKITNSKTISGKASNDGGSMYQFFNDLDLTDVTPGYHRLYYRAVSNSKRTVGAVSMTPIMVKSMYYTDNAKDLTVTEQSYWFDDEEPEIISVAHPKNLIDQPYTFDTRKFADGQHTLYMQFGNSAGVWSEPESSTFTKTRVNAPMIALNTSVDEGVVTFKYNSVPNGLLYYVVRQYPSGTTRRLDVNRNTDYPIPLQSTDRPAPGTYTYYVVGKYLDADGKLQEVRSGDVSVTVDKAASIVGRGTIHGVLTLDGKDINYPWPWVDGYRIYVNGKHVTQSGHSYKMESFGSFWIGDVPYGSEITIGIEHQDYYFKDIKLIVDENTSNKTYKFNGTKELEVDLQPDNAAYDLILADNVYIIPDANVWEIEVWNNSRKPWSGNIIVKVMNKEVKDFYDKSPDLSWGYYLLHPNAGIEDVPSYKTAADGHVHIDKGYSRLVLDITDLPKREGNEDYYVCVLSKKDGSDQMKELEYAGGINKPQVVNFNPFDCLVAQEKDFNSYINDYKEILKHIKAMSKWGDPFALEFKTLGDDFEDILKNIGNHTIDDDGLEKDIIVNGSQYTGMLLKCFLSDVHKAVKGTSEGITTSLKPVDGIIKVYNRLKGFYDSYHGDDNRKFFETSKQVLQLCDELNLSKYPALKVYKTYLEVGEAMVNAIEQFENKLSGRWVWQKLVEEGSGIYKIKVRKYPDGKSGVKYFSGSDFYLQKDPYKVSHYHSGQIRKISFTLYPPGQPNSKVDSQSFDVETTNDGIIIKNVVFSGKYNTLYDNTEAWMTIEWSNNRVTHVPLLNKNFVKLENFGQNSKEPPTMTVELQSETIMNKEFIPNKLTIVKQEKSIWDFDY